MEVNEKVTVVEIKNEDITIRKDRLPIHKEINEDVYVTLTRNVNPFTRQVAFKLPETLVFYNGSYECGLLQCYLPDKFNPKDKFYLPNGSYYNIIKYCKATDTMQILGHFKIELEDDFTHINDLILHINSHVYEYMKEHFTDRFSILLRFENNKLTLFPSINDVDVYSLTFSKELNDLLGFNERTLRHPTAAIPILHPSNTMFVHCDLIEPTLFNNSYEPVLRILSESLNSNLYPYYKSINKHFVTDIIISIKGSEGNYMSLTAGSVSFVLHIRKKIWTKNLL